MADRNYDDPCGVARALDHVGERWALLIVRELLFGPKRFNEIKTALPSISPNVLAHRLRELEASGVVTRADLGRPSLGSGYGLTTRGYALRPVIVELATWGSHAPMQSSAQLSTAALMVALLTTFDPARTRNQTVCVELAVAGECFNATVIGDMLDVTPGHATNPDAVIHADTTTLRSLVFGRQALRTEHVTGDKRAATRFLGLFPRRR